jgi:hypothetical protein
MTSKSDISSRKLMNCRSTVRLKDHLVQSFCLVKGTEVPKVYFAMPVYDISDKIELALRA